MYNINIGDVLYGGDITPYETDEEAKVYFLIKDDHVIYVGQSINLDSRLGGHASKGFDSVSYLRVAESELNNVEAFYIVKFNPVLNKALPSNKHYIKEGAANKKIELIFKSLKAIKHNTIDCKYSVDSTRKANGKNEFTDVTYHYYKPDDVDSFVEDIAEHIGKLFHISSSEFIALGE